jgi:hypothetical protein
VTYVSKWELRKVYIYGLHAWVVSKFLIQTTLIRIRAKMSHAGEKSSLDQHVEKVPIATADLAEAQQLATQWVDGTPEEKRLVRKLDWRILPCTWVLYLLGFLDRANVGYFRLLQSMEIRVAL